MTDYKLGDVIRVDPTRNPQVMQPDDRQWLIIGRGSRGPTGEYVTIFMGNSFALNPIIHWSAKVLADGFIRVEDPE